MRDGLEALAEASAGAWDVIVLDAGSDDPSNALACPPPAFLDAASMAAAAAALAPGGTPPCRPRRRLHMPSALSRACTRTCSASSLLEFTSYTMYRGALGMLHSRSWSAYVRHVGRYKPLFSGQSALLTLELFR